MHLLTFSQERQRFKLKIRLGCGWHSLEELVKIEPEFPLVKLAEGIVLAKKDIMSTEENSAEQTKEMEQQEKKEVQELEKQEQVKLQMKYPQAVKPMAGHSAFLAKRLTKGQKYFDSGDYQMAKQSGKGKATRTMPPILSVPPEIPTPDSVSASMRKTSLVQQPSKLANNS